MAPREDRRNGAIAPIIDKAQSKRDLQGDSSRKYRRLRGCFRTPGNP